MILRSLKTSGVGPIIGFSQQYETQRDISSMVIYVQGGWLSSFVFKVTSTRFELKDDYSSLDFSDGARPHHRASTLIPTILHLRLRMARRQPSCLAP